MMRVRVLAVAVAMVVAALGVGCALRPPQPLFIRIAEGLTSPTLSEGIRVVPGTFASSQLVAACRNPRSVSRLETTSPVLDLQIGERFALSSLGVVAVSDADVALPDVPITIEAEETSPPVLQLRSDDPDLKQGRIYPLGSGVFRVRVRTLCSGPAAELIITGRVLP